MSLLPQPGIPKSKTLTALIEPENSTCQPFPAEKMKGQKN